MTKKEQQNWQNFFNKIKQVYKENDVTAVQTIIYSLKTAKLLCSIVKRQRDLHSPVSMKQRDLEHPQKLRYRRYPNSLFLLKICNIKAKKPFVEKKLL